MRETLVVSGRGQITLPAALRKRFGIKSGDVVILEEHGNEVVSRRSRTKGPTNFSGGAYLWGNAFAHRRSQRLWRFHEPTGKNF